MPAGAIGALRAGSLREGRAGGASWATASFVPSAKASALLQDGFQDGAGTGVFVQSGSSPWRLVHTGPYGCGRGLPATLQRSWHLAQAATCRVTPAQQRATAARFTARPADGASLRQRIADLALGQIGVSTNPTVSGFSGVDCDPFTSLVAGFSANDDGCGPDAGFGVQDANEAWCSDFAKWVWERAGVTADMNTLNAGSVSFYDWGLQQGEALAPETGTPQPGDAIVFFPPGTIKPTSFADHIGLVTSVNADGTIDMANGDFAGDGEVSVQYDTGIDLTTWPSTIWNQGEQWVIVTPPATAQQPAPDATMAGPHNAAAGTVTHFAASAAEPGGSVSQYFWTFGDGRSTNTTGTQVSHVFGEAGMYTVTVTVTSSFGTVTTRTWDVHVLGASSPVASAASDSVWFSNVPTDQWMFVRSGTNGLAADTSDGLSWLRFTVPGNLSERAGLTALSYPDPAAGYVMTPHAYYLSANGTLAQTYLGGTGWLSQQLAGQPADGSAIVATSTTAGPEVFYFNADGRLAESAEHGSSWLATTVGGPPTSDPGTLALAETGGGPVLFYRVGQGSVVASSPSGLTLPVATHAAAGSPLAAVTTPQGLPRVFFTDEAGRLAAATIGGGVAELPGSPAGTSLAATNYLLPGSATSLGTEVFYLTASGQPAVSYDDGSGWQAASLPAGTATALTAANAYQVAGQPTEAFTETAAGPVEYTAAGPAGPWSAQPLPVAPATFSDQVLLYAATPADEASAQAAAAAAGLPASQVTGSYDVAWDATLSGNYLVIAVGLPATDALFFNACGWANPSADDAGTPFFLATAPLDQLPPLDAYEEAAAATSSLTPQYAIDVAYYATHGTLPPGVTALPARAGLTRACAGQPG